LLRDKKVVVVSLCVFVRRLGPHHFAHLRAVAEYGVANYARRYLGIEHVRSNHGAPGNGRCRARRGRAPGRVRLAPGGPVDPSQRRGTPTLDAGSSTTWTALAEAEVDQALQSFPARPRNRADQLREQLELLRRLGRLAHMQTLPIWWPAGSGQALAGKPDRGPPDAGALTRQAGAGCTGARSRHCQGRAHRGATWPRSCHEARVKVLFALSATPALFGLPSPSGASNAHAHSTQGDHLVEDRTSAALARPLLVLPRTCRPSGLDQTGPAQ
jgi:hypothetical protein